MSVTLHENKFTNKLLKSRNNQSSSNTDCMIYSSSLEMENDSGTEINIGFIIMRMSECWLVARATHVADRLCHHQPYARILGGKKYLRSQKPRPWVPLLKKGKWRIGGFRSRNIAVTSVCSFHVCLTTKLSLASCHPMHYAIVLPLARHQDILIKRAPVLNSFEKDYLLIFAQSFSTLDSGSGISTHSLRAH